MNESYANEPVICIIYHLGWEDPSPLSMVSGNLPSLPWAPR
jgi:hypothetical protein